MATDPTTAPSALDALLREVEILSDEASPGPWAFETDYPDEVPYAVRRYVSPSGEPVAGHVDFCDKNRSIAEILPHPTNATDDYPLIASYRTAAPRLAAIVRVLVEAVTQAASFGEGPVVGPEFDCPYHAMEARAALSRAEAIAKGE